MKLLNDLKKLKRDIKTYMQARFPGYSPLNFKKGAACVIVPFTRENGFGFADRLRHCLSVYITCKDKGLPFKIHHTSPFRMELILEPNKYDWLLPEEDFSNSLWRTSVKKIGSYYKNLNISEKEEGIQQHKELASFLKKSNRQYHITGNIHSNIDRWSEAFDELFKPSPLLSEKLKELTLPSSYVGITLRFQNQLGDFKETDSYELEEEEKEKLIEKCLNEILKLHEQDPQSRHMLVTSDSVRFLKRVEKFDFVHTIPGEIAHPSYDSGKDVNVYLKSFLDLYALAKSEKITLLQTDNMYNSGFPEFAARIGGIDYQIHHF